MMKNSLRVLAITLALSIMMMLSPVSLAESASASGTEEPVTLTVFTHSAKSGVMEDTYWTKILKEDIGVILELLPHSDENLAAIIASGDYPDIITFNQFTELNDATVVGALVNLDEHQDKLPNVYANAGKAVQYVRDVASGGTGQAHGVGTGVSNMFYKTGDPTQMVSIRWDYYKAMGMPELNDIEDFLPLLKTMQDEHPTTEAGQKVYAISDWSDWGWHQGDLFAGYYGWSASPEAFVEYDIDGNMQSQFADESFLKRSIQFLFDANQMGILDPDSVSQKHEDATAKIADGRALTFMYGWNSPFNTLERNEQGIGMVHMPFANMKFRNSGANYVGAWPMAISANTKHLDKALELFDYMYNLDKIMYLYAGYEGEYWVKNAEGEPIITEDGWKIKNDSTLQLQDGGRPGDGIWDLNMSGLDLSSMNPNLGVRMYDGYWPDSEFTPASNAMIIEYREFMGANSSYDYLYAHNMVVEPPFAPMPPLPEEFRQSGARVQDLINTKAWEMVLAKDQAEFDALWAEMVETAKGIGVETIQDWFMTEYPKALAEGSIYMD